MTDKRTIILLLLLTFTGVSKLIAEETDTRTWIDLFATKKIRSATLGILGEIYTINNNSSIERTSIGAKGDYSFFPWLSMGTGYILLNFKRPGYHELASRFYFQAEPSWQLSKFFFSFRERVQITLFPSTRTNEVNNYYWRNRFEVCFKKGNSKFEPLVSMESLYLIKHTETNLFSEIRFTMGTFYHFAKNQKFKLYGMYTNGSILDRYIIGIVYDIKL